MSETPTDRETVERIIAKQPMLPSDPPQENDVAKTLRALSAERDYYKTRAERAEWVVKDLIRQIENDGAMADLREARAALALIEKEQTDD